jgi:uncharacterized protein YndB with AHSA1/START domain
MKTDPNPKSPVAPAARAVTDGETVLATIDVAASPDRVFHALNTIETERWWGSDDVYRQTDWTSDVRVGGRWHVTTRMADGSLHPSGGEFLEVSAPRKVVITRIYEFDFPMLGRRATQVTYLCDPISTGTRVTVRHDGFAGLREIAELHASGWERVLGWLHSYLQSETSK